MPRKYIMNIRVVRGQWTQDPATFRETDRSSENPTPSTSKDTFLFIKVQRSLTCNRMTTPADKETPTKIQEIENPIPKLLRQTVKRKQFACVLTSPYNIHKKTVNPKLIKEAAKKRKLVGASASASLQQNASSPIKDDIMCALSAGKITSERKKRPIRLNVLLVKNTFMRHAQCTF